MKLYRPVPVLVGVLLVLLGGLVRLGEPAQVLDDVTRQLVTGTIGQRLAGEDFSFTVSRLRLAHKIVKDPDDEADEALGTEGIFVTIEFDVAGSHVPRTVGNLTLRTDDGAVYEPLSDVGESLLATPAPGFTESQVAVFEVNPADLTGLALRVTPIKIISYFATDYAVDLAVPSDGVAAELVASAAKEYVAPKTSLRVSS